MKMILTVANQALDCINDRIIPAITGGNWGGANYKSIKDYQIYYDVHMQWYWNGGDGFEAIGLKEYRE